MRVLESNDTSKLICKVEITDHCVTFYGRCFDDYPRFSEEMQDLIKAVKPDTTAHFSDEERAKFHPDGGPRKNKYKYIHHVHMPGTDIERAKEVASPWLPEDIKEKL